MQGIQMHRTENLRHWDWHRQKKKKKRMYPGKYTADKYRESNREDILKILQVFLSTKMIKHVFKDQSGMSI